MAKNDIGGVWRTIGGRRVFIKDGQDLATAMKESGKFNHLSDKAIENNIKVHHLEDKEPENNFANEVKNYKLKDDNEYHTAKEVLLSRFNRTYNDGDTIKDKFEERMNNIRILEEDTDYLLYASKDEDGFINIQEISSYDPKSRFRDMPNVYFEQDYKGNIKKGSVQVNWSAYGSQNPETTKEFITKLTKAQKFAEKINEGKDYTKLWNNQLTQKSNNNIASDLSKVSSKTKLENAFREYKLEHPNSKLSLQDFKNLYK